MESGMNEMIPIGFFFTFFNIGNILLNCGVSEMCISSSSFLALETYVFIFIYGKLIEIK